jgi:phytoene desaturase
VTRSAVVIGSGIGGLTAAIHLAQAEWDVTVLEQNARPGGRCGRFERDGHRFDSGPTLLVMPLVYESEFRALGSSAAEVLDLSRVDPTYELVFDDGSGLSLTSDRPLLGDALERIEAGSAEGLERYLAEGRRHYDFVLDRMVTRDVRLAADLYTLTTGARALFVKPFAKHYRHMSAFFSAPRLKSAFTFQDLYVGLSPFEAPATFSLLPYSELAHGVWYPRGGMYSVVEALVALALQAGVRFQFGTPVAEIITRAQRAAGVRLDDGSEIGADVVLANADLPYVYDRLLPPNGVAKSLLRKQYSCSAVSFFWALDHRCSALAPHTLFLADDARANYDAITHGQGLPANPSLYVHAPARLDPSVAPAGHDSVTAIVPVSHLDDAGRLDWDELRERAREHVFRRLASIGVTDVDTHIKWEESLTPTSWALHHNLVKGSTHGLSHKLSQMAFFRPSNRHRQFRNLYFAGASTHPGTGVPMAMISGRLAAQRITAEQRGH